MRTLKPPKWLWYLKPLTEQREQAEVDLLEQERYLQNVSFLDVLNFDVIGPVALGTNITHERVPTSQSGLIIGLKAHSKSPGAGNVTFAVRANNNVVGSITLSGGSSAVQSTAPTANQVCTDLTRFSLDCTAVSGTWEHVLVTVVIEPRIL